MSLSNNTIARTYNKLFVELADPRTNDWFLITSPIPGLTIIYLYLQFVLKWGPRYMADKQPFQLQKTMVVYNFLQVLVSCWVFHEVARGVYIYFLAKMTELLDTVFFVIRKKERQITFLHMYHHTVMPMISWGATKYYPGGHGTLIGVMNSFVHIIMYTYYMFAAMGPKYQRFFAWKRHITTLQMVQFCIAFLHSSQLLFYDCGYPRWSVVFTLPNSIFFYYLFYDFYYKSYKKPEEAKTNGQVNKENGLKDHPKIGNGTNEIKYQSDEKKIK
ncbi:hypothetical protein MSG28_007437 [Choristoneura fumiferana]|uniref:Uncharacterized protein n=1 Tax=Choristoneura fumiferana TaxID=7141 RepID=A0ACC0JX66_CHOFU|nr:hypothetical protein MSG28_007437 [Choristoneura fumiferana]